MSPRWRALFVALALIAAAREARAEQADPRVREVLGSERYRFCHEKDYPLTPGEHAFCAHVGEVNEACPALPAACALPPVEGRALGTREAGRGSLGGGRDVRRREGDIGERPAQPDTRRRPEPERTTSALPDLSGLAKVLLVVLLIAFVIAVGRGLMGNFVRDRDADRAAEEAPAPSDADASSAAARGPVETDVERLLDRARKAASNGDYRAAIDDTYAALLRRLDGDGLIDIHPSRTNGDYVRALGDRPDLKRAVREVVRDVERVQFGDAAASESLYRAVLDRVAPIAGRALALALLILGMGSPLSCVGAPPAGGGTEGDTSPSGAQALIDVLGKHGITTRFRSEGLGSVKGARTIVLLPGAHVDAAAWEHLASWVQGDGGRLVLAGVDPPEDLDPDGDLDLDLDLDITTGTSDVARVDPGWAFESEYGGQPLILPPGPRLVDDASIEAEVPGVLLHRAGSAYAVQRRRGKGSVTVFADARLFTNIALAVPADAAFITRFFTLFPAPREVELCDGWTGIGAATPFASVQRARLTPAILQLFALLALFLLWRGRAFARLADPPAETRRSFADHARALGLAYARARASRHVLGLYGAWALERLRERVHRGGRQGLLPVAEAVAARTGRSEAEVMRVLIEAGDARDEAAPPSLRHPGPRRARRDEAEADLAIMREIETFIAVTGQRKSRSRAPTS